MSHKITRQGCARCGKEKPSGSGVRYCKKCETICPRCLKGVKREGQGYCGPCHTEKWRIHRKKESA